MQTALAIVSSEESRYSATPHPLPSFDRPSRPKELYRGGYLRLCKSPAGWEYVERSRGSGVVAIIPLTSDKRIVLTRQFRHSLERDCIDLPAGLVADEAERQDENEEQAALKELVEETGYASPHKLVRLFQRPTSAGLTNETVTFFFAKDVQRVAAGGGTADENIAVLAIPVAEVDKHLEQWQDDGFLIDPKVEVALRYVERKVLNPQSAGNAG